MPSTNGLRSTGLPSGSCGRGEEIRAAQFKISDDNATTAALVKPCDRTLVNGGSPRKYDAGPQMVSPAGSIFDGETLADFVHALVERIEARVDGAVVEIKDVATGKEREDPMMVLDIAEHRLDGLAHECGHAPHNVHVLPPGTLVSAHRLSLRRWRPNCGEPSTAPQRRVAARGSGAAKRLRAWQNSAKSAASHLTSICRSGPAHAFR